MAVRLLSRRRYFRREIETRLMRKFSPEEVREAIRSLMRKGYINDADTSLAAVEEWVLKRGRGVRWVEVLLGKLGLEEDIEIAANNRAKEIEYEGAVAVARRLMKLQKSVPEIQTALYRRGFRPETVETLLSSIGGVENYGNDEYHHRSSSRNHRDGGGRTARRPTGKETRKG